MSRLHEFYYCGIVDRCIIDQLEDNIALEEGYGTDRIAYLTAPMTPEEEEMLSADLGTDTQDTA